MYVHAKLETLQVVDGHCRHQMTALLLYTSLYDIELYGSTDWRASAPDMHHGHSLIQHCMCVQQACTIKQTSYISM